MSLSRNLLVVARCFTTLLAFAALPAVAGGVQIINTGAIPAATHTIRLGGSLDDWPSAEPARYAPLDPGLATEDTPALRLLRATDHSAALRLCYDKSALYAAVDWHGPHAIVPASATSEGDSVALDILIGSRMVHVRLTPGRAAAKASVADGAWSAHGVTAASTPDADNVGYTEQVRLPWLLLTGGTQPGTTQSIQMVMDCTWHDITPALLRTLPKVLRHLSMDLPECILSSDDKKFTLAGYIASNDFGRLAFTDQPAVNTTETSPLATAATVMNISRVFSPPNMDGALTSWSAPSFLHAAYMPGFIDDRFSARIAATYDNHNLYIGMYSRSAGPMYNSEPENTQQGYWGGDCLQIRLNDGSQTVNLCGWYDSTNSKPALTADGADLKNPFLLTEGARETFHADPDGHGYTQEIAIPWAVISKSGAAPATGSSSWHGTFQVWYAGLNPHFSAYTNTTLQPAGALTFSYTVPEESNVTVGLFDRRGHLQRWLLRDEHRRAGKQTEAWDGLDQYGNPLTAGSYVIKGLYHQPIGLQYKMTVGNPGNPPWPTPDGKGGWIGDESSPQGVATDGDWVFLASPCAEDGNNIIALDSSGQRQWGFSDPDNPRCISLAVSGNYLYALLSGPRLTNSMRLYTGDNAIGRAVLICLDKRTGVPAGLSQQKLLNEIATWPYREDVHYLWDLRNNHDYTAGTYGGQPRYFGVDVGESTNALGIAATDSRVYTSMFYDDKILVLDALNSQQLDSIPVPNPVGLHALSDGSLLAVSGAMVVHIDPQTKAVQPLISDHLVAPHDVTTDSAGNIYVSDWGTSFQVKVFTPQGRYLRAIGKPGGRPWVGAWDPAGMLVPRGVGVTNAGKLWVAEDDVAAKRVSVWDAGSGALVRDYLGPTAYGGGGPVWFDPKDPATLFTTGALFHVDMANKTWTPISIPMRRAGQNQPFEPVPTDGIPGSRVFYHDGHQYVAVSSGNHVDILMRDGILYHPVAALGAPDPMDPRVQDTWDSDIGHHRYKNYFPDFFAGKSAFNYTWTDTNGDGLVQADEMHWIPSGKDRSVQARWGTFWGAGVGPDGSVYLSGDQPGHTLVYRLDVQGWTSGGAPIYDPASAKVIVDSKPLGVQGISVDDENHVYLTDSYEFMPAGATDAFDCYDRDGKFLWAIARQKLQGLKDPQGQNVDGEFHSSTLGDIAGTWSWHGNNLPYLFTSDGLYITSLLDNTTKLGPTAEWGESYAYYFTGADGAPYIVNGANDALHILAITGLNTGGRFTGTLTLTAKDVKAAAALLATPKLVEAPKPIIHVQWLSAAPTIDGNLGDWNMDEGVHLAGSNGRSATVALGRDAKNLYLAYHVQGASLVNKGSNWQSLFITGDCCDLMLSTGHQQAAHYQPAEGDERLLLSVYQGQPIAVLYHQVVPGTQTPVVLMAARIDQIVKLTSAKIAVRRAGGSYTLEASAPLTDMGIDPSDTRTLTGDVGVIYADATGANRALRLYYYNKTTTMTNDLTTEATLQPGEWGKVQLPLGPNLLKNGGFEEPLAADPTHGWAMTQSQNGGVASLTADEAFDGLHSLQLEQTTPVVFPDALYNNPDYTAFIKSANGGAGGGSVTVTQTVPVTPGQYYHLRFHYRTQDFQPEHKGVGKPRGYVALDVGVAWNHGPRPGGFGVYNDVPDWQTITDAGSNGWNVSKAYQAPSTATSAQVIIYLRCNAADHLPKADIDDIELTPAAAP